MTTMHRRVWLRVALTLGLIVVIAALGVSRASRDARNGSIEGGVVAIGHIWIPVDGHLGDNVFQAALGPMLDVDTAPLGIGQPVDRTPVAPPWGIGRPAVLVGSNPSVDATGLGGSLFYYARGVGLIQRFLAWLNIGDPHVVGCVGSAAGSTCAAGSLGLGSTVTDDPEIPVVLEWYVLPDDTALVVVLNDDGDHLLWQRPVGRLAYLAVPMEVGATIRLEAWNSRGETLATEAFTRCDLSGGAPPLCR